MFGDFRRCATILLEAIGWLFAALPAAAQVPFTVTGVDGTGYTKARVTCIGMAEKRKSAIELDKPQFDLQSQVSCSNPTIGSSASATDHTRSATTVAGLMTRLTLVYEADASAFQASAEANFKLEGESDTYWEVKNTSKTSIVIDVDWSTTARTKLQGLGLADADSSFGITDANGNSIVDGNGDPLGIVGGGGIRTGKLLICVPPGSSFFISMYATAHARATSLSSTKGSTANGFANVIISLNATNYLAPCDSVVFKVPEGEDPPPDPPLPGPHHGRH